VSLVLPKWYTATALLLPPKTVSVPFSNLSDWSEALSLTAGLNLPVRATPSDIYYRMLKSRAVTSRVIETFDLAERYDADNYEETYLALMEYARISVSEEGLIQIAVEDKDPNVAADIANSFVEELENVSSGIVSDRISKTREFLSERLEQVKSELDSSRAQLEEFQMKHKAVDFDEQTRLAIERAAALKVNLAEVEFEARLSALTLGKDNVEMVKLNRKREIIQDQLRQLETENSDSSFFSLPVAAIPSLRGEYESLFSKVEVAEALYSVLLEQNEQAKVREYENLPSVSVLDPARPPTMRSWPQRSLIVGVSAGLSVIFAIFLAAVMEYFSRLRHTNPEDYEKLMHFVDAFFGWLPGVKFVDAPPQTTPPDQRKRQYNVDVDS
jgi:uncharacterized protein involved in exopolysaccharide biosynthesis